MTAAHLRAPQPTFEPETLHGCRTKVAHASQAVAKTAARLLGINVYRCPQCGAWHTTSHGKPLPRPARMFP